MTSRRCTCGAQLAPGAELCPACTGATLVRLYDAPRVLRELQVNVARLSSRPDSAGGYPSCAVHGCTHGPDEPGCVQGVALEFDQRAARSADRLSAILRRYVGEWGRTTRIRGDQAAEVAGMMATSLGRAALLAASGIASRTWAPDLAAELRPAIEDAWSCVDRPPSTSFVGWCGCGRALYARDDNGIAVCVGCGERFDASASRAEMMARLPGIGERQMSKPDLALLCGIPVGTLHRWSSERRIMPVGVNRRGQPLYLAGPVIDAALRGMPPERLPMPEARPAS